MAARTTSRSIRAPRKRPIMQAGLAAAWLAMAAGCGGGGSDSAASAGGSAPVASADEAVMAGLNAQPTFQRQPLALDEPDPMDEDGSNASAAVQPKSFVVPAAVAGLDKRQLTDDEVASWLASETSAKQAIKAVAAPASVYTPAQIRAAYRMPALPASNVALTAGNAAPGGAGQTIYLIDAYHHPNAVADLQKFNQKFGLPACTQAASPRTASRLATPAANSACTIMVVYSAGAGAIASSAPAYDAAWASEIALDTQWAHASAPYARIVLIEAQNASLTALSDAVKLANTLGPGIVSMSFGSSEGTWVGSASTAFQSSGMTYVASTGDAGNAVNWPAVAPTVVAVGGTSLTYTSAGTRTEAAWSGTGGGISGYVTLPSYQQSLAVAGQTGSALRSRAVADLSFNADPNTGQYVAFTASGSSQTNWYAFGGTSLSAPQIAGLLGTANALRATKNLAAIGIANTMLYGRFAPKSANWSSSFNDIVSGRDGTCAVCAAGNGYDIPTGLGTPRADYLLSVLAGS